MCGNEVNAVSINSITAEQKEVFRFVEVGYKRMSEDMDVINSDSMVILGSDCHPEYFIEYYNHCIDMLLESNSLEIYRKPYKDLDEEAKEDIWEEVDAVTCTYYWNDLFIDSIVEKLTYLGYFVLSRDSYYNRGIIAYNSPLQDVW